MQSNLMETYYPYADKLAARQYVQQCVGSQYLTELYGVYETYEDIDFSALPQRFILKTNHGCGGHLPCMDKAAFCQDRVRQQSHFHAIMKQNYSEVNGERQYNSIKPCLYSEELLPLGLPFAGLYRVFSFAGEPRFIQVTGYSSEDNSKVVSNYYDCHWNTLPFTIAYRGVPCMIEKPANLTELLEVARTLAAPFPFVRVDLYNLGGNRIVFSELTFTPYSGFAPIQPLKWDFTLGDLFPYPFDDYKSRVRK